MCASQYLKACPFNTARVTSLGSGCNGWKASGVTSSGARNLQKEVPSPRFLHKTHTHTHTHTHTQKAATHRRGGCTTRRPHAPMNIAHSQTHTHTHTLTDTPANAPDLISTPKSTDASACQSIFEHDGEAGLLRHLRIELLGRFPSLGGRAKQWHAGRTHHRREE